MNDSNPQPLQVGQRVSHLYGGDDGQSYVEYGIVIAVWLDENGLDWDTYVAFYDGHWPTPEEKPVKPYVLRYYASSLKVEEG